MIKYKLPFSLTKKDLDIINSRLKEFKELYAKDNNCWFNELCFCLLTANSKAQTAINIQNHLGNYGFLNFSQEEIAKIIREHGHRFHNTKAKYIVESRKFQNIKDIILNLSDIEAREFLVKNIKGLGYKEASHFLRNVGYNNVAIIDRHIIRFLVKYNYFSSIPKLINKKIYLKAEEVLKKFKIPLDKLDLMIWYHMTGKVLK